MKKIKKIKKIKSKKKTNTNIKSSKIEVVFGEWLESIGIKVSTQLQLHNKYYDFLIKGTNIIIEFHGDYYHANPLIYENKELNAMQIRNKKNDIKKNYLAKINGYEIIYVWENEFHNHKNKIKKMILQLAHKNKTVKV